MELTTKVQIIIVIFVVFPALIIIYYILKLYNEKNGYEKCIFCGEYDNPKYMIKRDDNVYYHEKCVQTEVFPFP